MNDDITLTESTVLKFVQLAPRSEWDQFEAAQAAQLVEDDRSAS